MNRTLLQYTSFPRALLLSIMQAGCLHHLTLATEKPSFTKNLHKHISTPFLIVSGGSEPNTVRQKQRGYEQHHVSITYMALSELEK